MLFSICVQRGSWSGMVLDAHKGSWSRMDACLGDRACKCPRLSHWHHLQVGAGYSICLKPWRATVSWYNSKLAGPLVWLGRRQLLHVCSEAASVNAAWAAGCFCFGERGNWKLCPQKSIPGMHHSFCQQKGTDGGEFSYVGATTEKVLSCFTARHTSKGSGACKKTLLPDLNGQVHSYAGRWFFWYLSPRPLRVLKEITNILNCIHFELVVASVAETTRLRHDLIVYPSTTSGQMHFTQAEVSQVFWKVVVALLLLRRRRRRSCGQRSYICMG